MHHSLLKARHAQDGQGHSRLDSNAQYVRLNVQDIREGHTRTQGKRKLHLRLAYFQHKFQTGHREAEGGETGFKTGRV